MDKATIRLLILNRLTQAYPYAITVSTLRVQLRHEGCDIESPEVTDHLRALADEALVNVDRDSLDKDVRRWRVTEKGRSYLAAQG
jgi:DNA-binding MarR family transcriptional regulator